MKRFFIAMFSIIFALTLGACSMNDVVRKAIEDDPSIVFSAIEKDPEKFLEVANKAGREAQRRQQEKAAAEQAKQREADIANPKPMPPVDGRVIMGPKDAPVTIIEWSDFQCFYCAQAWKTVQEIKKEFPKEVRVVYKHLPLSSRHPEAKPAALMYEAIALQSHEKAIKFHDKIFQAQNELNQGGQEWLKKTAKSLGVNMKKLDKDISKVKAVVAADIKEAQGPQYGCRGTPCFLVEGVPLRGAYPKAEFVKIIKKVLEKKGS